MQTTLLATPDAATIEEEGVTIDGYPLEDLTFVTECSTWDAAVEVILEMRKAEPEVPLIILPSNKEPPTVGIFRAPGPRVDNGLTMGSLPDER